MGDVVSTRGAGSGGYDFIKLDAGMTEVLRPSLYGAQHPVTIVPKSDDPRSTEGAATKEYVVVGHCCESGDLLTPAVGEPEVIAPRSLVEAEIGDAVVIGSAGAYCA